eukprot:TRINITY_DN3170_c0_g1_i1.p1 TRINITY_DN3170_c0_g1~~TRINITY_DN3170_c0_g1_i1.p1  ORF type:complete len:285 (-),score=-24.51 TRINITY_DN3170_c0_g1_i1:291-1145(-)
MYIPFMISLSLYVDSNVFPLYVVYQGRTPNILVFYMLCISEAHFHYLWYIISFDTLALIMYDIFYKNNIIKPSQTVFYTINYYYYLYTLIHMCQNYTDFLVRSYSTIRLISKRLIIYLIYYYMYIGKIHVDNLAIACRNEYTETIQNMYVCYVYTYVYTSFALGYVHYVENVQSVLQQDLLIRVKFVISQNLHFAIIMFLGILNQVHSTTLNKVVQIIFLIQFLQCSRQQGKLGFMFIFIQLYIPYNDIFLVLFQIEGLMGYVNIIKIQLLRDFLNTSGQERVI